MNISGKVCLVTGGTRGIGAATALALAREGGRIVITGRTRDEDTERTLSELENLKAPHKLLLSDCGVARNCGEDVAGTVEAFGGIDVLVHAAGGPVNGGLLEITPEMWHAAFDVHVHAVFYLCRAAIPHLRQRKEGAIVLVSSTAGLRGIKTNIAYQAAKGALPQITRALAREFADDNIRVNCVAPGVVRTRFHAAMTPEQKKLNLEQRIPLHREGTPEQVASVIRELVANDYMTGETVTVDGGLTMRIA